MSTIDPKRYQEFTKKLRQARLDAGFTQVEVAISLGKHVSFISKCETGERRVDFVELEILAEAYGKDLSYFKTTSRRKPKIKKLPKQY